MQHTTLGTTDIKVSTICLGTMTWGYQNTEEEAHEQIQYALGAGINFLDTAELYAVPPSKDTYGVTERYIGTFFAQHPELRKDIILATKIAGPGLGYIRQGEGYTPKGIENAVTQSLARLQTDYIDLYQLHWPQRNVPRFGIRDFEGQWSEEDDRFSETLHALGEQVKKGHIRAVGVSNETPWGLMRALQLSATDSQLPRIQSVQNVYNLLSRATDMGLSEVVLRETISFLPYSPLAGGLLTGKYQDGARPENARFSTWGSSNMWRYVNSRTDKAVQSYCMLAKEQGLSPAILALAFVHSRPFVTSNIIGATTMEQLRECVNAHTTVLSEDVQVAIKKIHDENANPAA